MSHGKRNRLCSVMRLFKQLKDSTKPFVVTQLFFTTNRLKFLGYLPLMIVRRISTLNITIVSPSLRPPSKLVSTSNTDRNCKNCCLQASVLQIKKNSRFVQLPKNFCPGDENLGRVLETKEGNEPVCIPEEKKIAGCVSDPV